MISCLRHKQLIQQQKPEYLGFFFVTKLYIQTRTLETNFVFKKEHSPRVLSSFSFLELGR